jgi:hypothetical protein
MIEVNKIIVPVFLEFKRAFKTIDRELLLRKMEQHGIKDAELSWFRSHLNRMNDDLVSLFQWLGLNKLKLNVQKTKYTWWLLVKIGDNVLECVKYMKYLGEVIDDRFKFNKNLEMLQKKICEKIKFIRKQQQTQQIQQNYTLKSDNLTALGLLLLNTIFS